MRDGNPRKGRALMAVWVFGTTVYQTLILGAPKVKVCSKDDFDGAR